MKFYWYLSRPAMCTATQALRGLLWISPIYYDRCRDSSAADYLTLRFSNANRACWSDLGTFTPEYSWFDIVILAYIVSLLIHFLHILIIVVKVYQQSQKVPVPKPLINALAKIMGLNLIFFVLSILFHYNKESLIYSPNLRHTVHSQLTGSLPRYNEEGFHLREAWDNTMTDGCCGVDGYQDFSHLNMSIPSVCQREVPLSCTEETFVAGTKIFAVGCVDAVMSHIVNSEGHRILVFQWLIMTNMVIMAAVFAILNFCVTNNPQSVRAVQPVVHTLLTVDSISTITVKLNGETDNLMY